jgi:hypothetical protein
MDLDFGSIWTWTLPLWGLFLIVLFLAGVLSDTVVLQEVPKLSGGAASKKVRFSLDGHK